MMIDARKNISKKIFEKYLPITLHGGSGGM